MYDGRACKVCLWHSGVSWVHYFKAHGCIFNRAARRNSILTILLDVLRATYEPPSMSGILSRQRSPAKP